MLIIFLKSWRIFILQYLLLFELFETIHIKAWVSKSPYLINKKFVFFAEGSWDLAYTIKSLNNSVSL